MQTRYKFALFVAGVVLNIGLGLVVRQFQLPIYGDAVGTVVVTLLLGTIWGAGAGVLSFVVWGLALGNGVAHYFVLTQVAIAVFVGFVASKGWLKYLWSQLASGVALGVVTGLVSAPVLAIVFPGGDTGTGRDQFAQFLLDTTGNMYEALLLSGAFTEPIDKVLVLLLAIYVVTSLPRRMTKDWQETPYLRDNDLA